MATHWTRKGLTGFVVHDDVTFEVDFLISDVGADGAGSSFVPLVGGDSFIHHSSSCSTASTPILASRIFSSTTLVR